MSESYKRIRRLLAPRNLQTCAMHSYTLESLVAPGCVASVFAIFLIKPFSEVLGRLSSCGVQNLKARVSVACVSLSMPKERRQRITRGRSSQPTGRVKASKAVQKRDALIEELKSIYASHHNPSAALQAKRYLRNKFDCFGIKAPERRSISKAVLSKMSKDITQPELIALSCDLWRQNEREFQYFALDLISKECRVFVGESSAEFIEAKKCLEWLITTKSWWDTVDLLASNVTGALVRKHPTEGTELVKTWIDSDNLWLRRTSLLHQLKFRSETDADLLFEFCLKCCNEKDFFIRKAIGWALRQYRRTDSLAVDQFVEENKECLSELSQKEALKAKR